jgi:alkanesulfonate monooxygenase SsuD/methylene tetrahydromethanopterin reductase-like flavin-dependent oxidoreductase (luciferase family)
VAPLLIGLGLSTSPGPGIDPIAEARLAEELGFDYVSASDHLNGKTPTYEPWTLLSAVAGATSRVRVLTRVLAVPYRHPAVLAKMAETLDRLSDGRLILGLGGGFVDEEFQAFGLAVPTNRDRVDGVAEQIAIARATWSGEPATYEGRLYGVDEALVLPPPAHRIPIWLGMYKPRGLALTGREADGWIPSIGFAPPSVVTGLWERVQAAARDAGRDPSAITAAYNMLVQVGSEQPGNVMTVSGSAASVTEQLLGFRKLGFSSFNVVPVGGDKREEIERFGRDVLPALRTAS